MSNQNKANPFVKKNNNKSFHPDDEDITEELLSDPIPSQEKKRKKLYVLFGSVAGICLLIALTFFVFGQMKTSEINKSLDLGEKYLEEGKYEDAIIAFDSVIAIDPKQVPAYEGKAEVYVITQNYVDAEESLIKAREIAPSSKTNLLLVEVYDHTQKPDQAKKLLEETVTLLEADIKQTTDKTELTKLYDELILTCQRLDKDNDYLKKLFDQALLATGDNKYETLKKNLERGNITGNSSNDGLATQLGDWIYYRNNSDNGTLYKIKTDNTQKIKLNNEKSKYINVVGDWVYYTNEDELGSINKIKTDGTNKTKLSNDKSANLNVIGDWIYYSNGSAEPWRALYKIRTDGTEQTRITDTNAAYFAISGDWIYYSINPEGFRKIKTDGTSDTLLSSDFVISLSIVGDWIYYSKYPPDYMPFESIFKIKTDGTERTKILTNLKFDNSGNVAVNADDGWIYFNNNFNHNALYKMRPDGSDQTKIGTEGFRYINIVGDWIYGINYRIKTDGTDQQKIE